MGLLDLYNNAVKSKSPKLNSPQDLTSRPGEDFFSNEFQTNFTKNMVGKITQLTELGKSYFDVLIRNQKDKQENTPDNPYSGDKE